MPAYSGPVLLESRAAAELLAEMLGASVSGSRPPVSMVPMYDQIMESRGGRSEWLGRLNSRVLPAGTSLADDPLAKDAQGRPLPVPTAWMMKACSRRPLPWWTMEC